VFGCETDKVLISSFIADSRALAEGGEAGVTDEERSRGCLWDDHPVVAEVALDFLDVDSPLFVHNF
jgi:hypothetical protein